jgi:hypothetical protein
MNLSLGLYRLAQAIKWFGRLVGGLWLIGLIYGVSTDTGKSGFIGFFVAAIIFIAITEGIAWILEGFAND